MCNFVNTRFLRPYGVITEITTKSPQKLYNGSSFGPHSTQKSSFYPLKSFWPQVLKIRFHLWKHWLPPLLRFIPRPFLVIWTMLMPLMLLCNALLSITTSTSSPDTQFNINLPWSSDGRTDPLSSRWLSRTTCRLPTHETKGWGGRGNQHKIGMGSTHSLKSLQRGPPPTSHNGCSVFANDSSL